MAEINFVPVCSNCKKIITTTIDYTIDDENEYTTKNNYLIKQYQIKPYRCPYCGEHFEIITMPTKLPFEYSYHNIMTANGIHCKINGENMVNKTELTSGQIYDVLISIIGNVEPVADASIDTERLKNLKKLESVADYINEKILKISKEYYSPYSSVKTIAEEAYNWVNFWNKEFSSMMIKTDGNKKTAANELQKFI